MAGILLQGRHTPASQRIPLLAEPFVSDRARKVLDALERFVEERCIPADYIYEQQLGQGTDVRFRAHPPILEELKTEAKRLGFWNMFLGRKHYGSQGAGFTNVEFGLIAEILGKSFIASEATNNAAPDTGNMEVLAKYGTDEQKKRWLKPLLDGEIRSSFLMTEPQVASSDARNIELSIVREKDTYVMNGQVSLPNAPSWTRHCSSRC
jgi:acyl-CoA dehydrogenase